MPFTPQGGGVVPETPDNTTPNSYVLKGLDEFINGTMTFNNVLGRNESAIPFYAPEIISDVSSLNLGGASSIKNAGENITFRNNISGDNFNPVWIKQGVGEKPFARATHNAAVTIDYELSKADILVNPSWDVTITGDHRSIAYSVEADTTITNCTFEARSLGEVFYTADFGTLVADVEKLVDLEIDPNVPVDVFDGQTYELTIVSPDGDVRLKGSTANSSPFFRASALAFSDLEVMTDATLMPRIDASLSTNLTLDTTLEEKVIPFDVDLRSSGITLSAGAFTVTKDGRYHGDLTLQIDETGDPTFMVWLEVKPLSTGVWVLGGGLRKTKIKDDTFYTITLAGTMELSAGDQVRISTAITSSTDTAIIKEVSQVLNLGTAVQPAATISIDWMGPLTP